MAEVRFEVVVNGSPVCIAGLDGFGCLEVRLAACRFEGQPGTPISAPEPPQEHLEMTIGGHDFSAGDLGWGRIPLTPGDDVRLRVLGPGPTDPPAVVNPPTGPDEIPF